MTTVSVDDAPLGSQTRGTLYEGTWCGGSHSGITIFARAR